MGFPAQPSGMGISFPIKTSSIPIKNNPLIPICCFALFLAYLSLIAAIACNSLAEVFIVGCGGAGVAVWVLWAICCGWFVLVWLVGVIWFYGSYGDKCWFGLWVLYCF